MGKFPNLVVDAVVMITAVIIASIYQINVVYCDRLLWKYTSVAFDVAEWLKFHESADEIRYYLPIN